ncbi:hypothetical protein ACKVMT_05910 [Halobacteriales archaeon Cl-PHB]
MTGWPPKRSLSGVVGSLLATVTLLAGATAPALAHGGSLPGGRQELTTPTWLVLVTGGAAVGASFLLASLVTDRSLVRTIDDWRAGLPALVGRDRFVALVRGLFQVAGLLALGLTVVGGILGPPEPLGNLAILLVWVGWWAGYTMSSYLLGNTWPAVNPWRTISRPLPSLGLDYPANLGAWPAVAGLAALVWVEIANPVAADPSLLVGLVLGYSAVTLAGALTFGDRVWFRRADPVSRVFRYYGHVAPIGWEEASPSLRLPGAGLHDLALRGRSEVAFVVALVWLTTFDGLVTTPAWRSLATALVGAGLPPALLYPLGLLGGLGTFYGVYRLASRLSRRTAESFLATDELARQFAPPLLAIAAGYHLAHYLGYFLSLGPVLATVAASPFPPVPATVPTLVLPPWFDLVGMAAVLLGHLLAIWVAHATAFRVFPSRMQAIRSQYPFIAVMVLYTMTSLWVVSQPEVAVPYT